MRRSRRVSKARPHPHISQNSLKRRMSEVISLRERLAQAELQAGRVPAFLKERSPQELVYDKPENR
jgi:hypothetical protein